MADNIRQVTERVMQYRLEINDLQKQAAVLQGNASSLQKELFETWKLLDAIRNGQIGLTKENEL